MLNCIIGPSGTGKSSIVAALEEIGFHSVQSYTTRPKRKENETGHTFISTEEFLRLKEEKGMIAETYFDGNYYGVTESMLRSADLYVIDLAGLKMLKEKSIPYYAIGLSCSENVLRERMLHRGDSEEKVNARLENDRKMFEGYKEWCDLVINADAPLSSLVNLIYSVIRQQPELDPGLVNDIYISVSDKIARISCGAGDGLTPDDAKEGYVDYIDYTVYQITNTGLIEDDGGLILYTEPLEDIYGSLADAVPDVLVPIFGKKLPYSLIL